MSTEQKRIASPDALAGEIPNPKRLQIDDADASLVDVDSDSASLIDIDSDSASTLSPDAKDKPAISDLVIFPDFMIEELVDEPSFDDLAERVLKDGEVVRILEDFLETLADDSQHTLQTRALKHFYQAKNIWENHRFISILVKDTLPCSMGRYNLVASRKTAEFLMLKIRSDPSFEDVYKYNEPDSMMRSALSIWIGYWSNEYMTLLLVESMGRRALGLNYYLDDWEVVVNEHKTQLASGALSVVEEDIPVWSSPIADLRQDDSIKTLAEQLLKNPEAVKMAKELLMSLQDDVPIRRQDRYEYHVRHRRAVIGFWFDQLIVVQLIKALKESTHLLNILKKYSKGAQLLRIVERVTRIHRDPLLDPILAGDSSHKIRGALSILFGYWGEIDLTMMLCTICRKYGTMRRLCHTFDVSKDKVEGFEYLTDGPGDFEGLKNVLADKYNEDSVEYMDRFFKIRAKQESEESATKSDYGTIVSVLLKNLDIIYFSMRRFIPVT
ncbi:hypothetical protein CASFOL_025806 [Castilleja foliolosa]|uniref:Uncharacterized protein n=1 Tax=Castilleja foliolosa TaxID=1961234 RepID=A0ABD3CW58_9LAMI